VILAVFSTYAPFVPVPKIAPATAAPDWYAWERRVPTVSLTKAAHLTFNCLLSRAVWSNCTTSFPCAPVAVKPCHDTEVLA